MIYHKFSIITPEHNPKNSEFLMELFHSIMGQQYKNWEWVLFLNNGHRRDQLPSEILNAASVDSRINIIEDTESSDKIGDSKRRAFFKGTGDVLVEVDHDDLITPDCLFELNLAYQDLSAGFVYSDNAVLHMYDEFVPYDAVYGWSHKTYNHNGRILKAMNSFKPCSQSVCLIWYAPDHVRSWRRNVYHELNGHNPEFSICDDHELMIRTYLHTTMKHIPKVLYIYRVTGDNTWLHRNQAIQETTIRLYHQYAVVLAEKDARDNGLLLVDMGGGINPRPGYVTVDQANADYEVDLNNGLPFADNSVGVLNASHIIEHLRDPVKTMREIHRVLAHGGWAFIEVPSTDGRGAFQDPTHVSFWNQNSFWYYTDANIAKYIKNDSIRFMCFRNETWFPNQWMKDNNIPVVSAWLCAVKPNGPRLPGYLGI